MSGDDVVYAESVIGLAEAELAAFLCSARETLGCRDPLMSGSIWLETMEGLHWPAGGYEKFFRAVTILSICRMVSPTVAA